MLKFLVLPFVLAILGLIIVAVFLPRNREVKKLAEAQEPTSVWTVLWPLPVLAVMPFFLSWLRGVESWDNLSWLLYLLYLVFLSGLTVLGLAWFAGINLFVAAVPAAQEFGRSMTEAERRSTWRRARRAFDKFRAS